LPLPLVALSIGATFKVVTTRDYRSGSERRHPSSGRFQPLHSARPFCVGYREIFGAHGAMILAMLHAEDRQQEAHEVFGAARSRVLLHKR
jgi:hypothetical protein